MLQEAIPPTAFGPVSDFEQRYFQRYPVRRLFAVVSWGNAATMWLAVALNSHSDIFCVHAANAAISRFAGGCHLDGLAYMRALCAVGHTGVVVGDVHGVSRHELPALSAALGDRFRAAIVVREPLARLRSQFALFDEFAGLNGWGDLSYVEGMVRDAGFDPDVLTYRERLTFHGCNMLNAILEERELAPVYRSEDLTTSADVLCGFAEYLAGGSVNGLRDWARHAVAMDRRNRRSTARDFTDFEKMVVEAVVRPQAWDAYAALGYDPPPWARR